MQPVEQVRIQEFRHGKPTALHKNLAKAKVRENREYMGRVRGVILPEAGHICYAVAGCQLVAGVVVPCDEAERRGCFVAEQVMAVRNSMVAAASPQYVLTQDEKNSRRIGLPAQKPSAC